MERCDFLDFEAEESDDDDEKPSRRSKSDLKNGKYRNFCQSFCFTVEFDHYFEILKTQLYFNVLETYTKEEMARKTEDVADVVKRLEEKYKVEEDVEVKDEVISDDELSAYAEDDAFMDVDTEGLIRDVNLPSNMDSKLWRLKVKPGMERQLVMRLTNKLINQFNQGHPLMVMQVFESENTSGVIFVEAYKLSHVE